MQDGDAVWQHGSKEHGGSTPAKRGVEEIAEAITVTSNAAAENFGMTMQCSSIGGAPGRMGDGVAQHPDAICFNAAIWASLGDPSEALAWGGA